MKKIAGIVIITFAIFLIIFGGQKWLSTRDVNAVVDHFFTAVIEGDTPSAQQVLSSDLQQSMRMQLQKDDVFTLPPETGLTYSIHHTEISGTTAVVNVTIEKQGFRLKPIVSLEKSSTNLWQITKIENLTEDPLWEDSRKELARRNDNELAKQLQNAFASQKEITVEQQK